MHAQDKRAENVATASDYSHFRSSTSVAAYLKFSDKGGVGERAILEERVELGERSM